MEEELSDEVANCATTGQVSRRQFLHNGSKANFSNDFVILFLQLSAMRFTILVGAHVLYGYMYEYSVRADR